MSATVSPLRAEQSPPASDLGAGGNGSGFDARLRLLETQVARIDERVSGIQEHMATKNDITGLKVWILGGVLSAIVIAAGIAAAVVRMFLQTPPAG